MNIARNLNKFLLLENVKQAKQYLNKINLSEKDVEKFDILVDKLKKMPNLVDTFTRMIFIPNEDGSVNITDAKFSEAMRIVKWVIENKQIAKQLSKNIIDYKNLEELADDIIKLKDNRKVDKFKKSLYKSMREEVEKLSDEDKKIFDNLALQFLDLDPEYRKLFTPLKYFERNNISIKEFMKALDNFINKEDVNEEKKRVVQYIKDNDLKVVYNQDNILAIQVSDREDICNLGSEKWCIVYSQHWFNKYLTDEKYNTQYIVINFNIPSSNPNSMFGVTIKPNGDIYDSGSSQNKNNIHVPLNDIYEMTGMPKGTLISKHKEKYDNINANAYLLQDYIETGNVVDFIEKLSEFNVDNVDNFLKSSAGPFGFIIKNAFSIINNSGGLNSFFEKLTQLWERNYEVSIMELLNKIDMELMGLNIDDINNLKGDLSFDKVLSYSQKMIGKIYYNYFNIVRIFSLKSEWYDTLKIINWAGEHYKAFTAFKKGDDIKILPSTYPTKAIASYIFKYEWDAFAKFIENSNDITINFIKACFDSTITRAALMVGEDLATWVLGDNKENKLSHENYMKILNRSGVSEIPEFNYFLSFFITDEDKEILIDNGVHNFLSEKDRNSWVSVLEKIESKSKGEILNTLNSLIKAHSYNIENLISDFEQKIRGNVFKKILTQKTDDIISDIVNYPTVFTKMSNYLNFVNICQYITDKNLVNIFKVNIYLTFITTDGRVISSISSSISSYSPIYEYNSESFLELYENIDSIVRGVTKIIGDSRENNVYNYLIDSMKEFVENRLEYDYETFEQHLDEYNDMKIIFDEEGEDYGYFFENIEKVIYKWSNKRDSEESEKALRDFIIEEGDKFISVSDLLNEPEDYDYMTYDYIKFLGKVMIEMEEDSENNTIISYSKYLNNNEYISDFYENLGMKYDEEMDKWYYETDYEELSGFYERDDLDLEDISSVFYVDSSYYNKPEMDLDMVDVSNLKIIANYLKKEGMDIDMSIFDKYTNLNKLKYKEQMELYKKDSELSNLVSKIEEVLKEDNDEYDLDPIKDSINSAYSDVESEGITDEFWDSTVSNLSEIFNEWGEEVENTYGSNLLKWKGEKIMVNPDLDTLLSDDNIVSVSNYEEMSSFTLNSLIHSYLSMEGSLSLGSDDTYLYWGGNEEDYYNERLSDRLHYNGVYLDISESSIIKFGDYFK